MVLKLLIAYLVIGIIFSIMTNKLLEEEEFSWSFSLFVTLSWLPTILLCVISCIGIMICSSDEIEYYE